MVKLRASRMYGCRGFLTRCKLSTQSGIPFVAYLHPYRSLGWMVDLIACSAWPVSNILQT